MINVFPWLLDVAVVAITLSGIGVLVDQRPGSRGPTSRIALTILILGAAMAVFVSLVGDPPLLFADFRIAYYPAGVAVLDHPAALAPQIERGVIGFVNLPILAYLFAPFGAMPVQAAAGLFTLLGIVAIVWAGILMIRLSGVTGDRRLALIFLIAANGPLNYSLKEGNTSHFVLLGLVAALYLLRQQRGLAAGVLLAFVALIKLPLLLFGPYLLFRRNWPALAGFSFVCGSAVLLSLVVFGWGMHATWLDVAVRRFSDHTLSAFNVQSMQSFLLRLREPPPPLLDWTLSEVSSGQRRVGGLLSGLLYLTTVLAWIKGSRNPEDRGFTSGTRRQDIEYTLVLCLAVVSSPLSWSHYYCWLLLPIALFLGSQLTATSSPIVNNLCWVATVMVMPVVVALQFSNPIMMAFYTKIVVSSYLLGGLIWFGVLAWSLASRPAQRVTEERRADFGAYKYTSSAGADQGR